MYLCTQTYVYTVLYMCVVCVLSSYTDIHISIHRYIYMHDHTENTYVYIYIYTYIHI